MHCHYLLVAYTTWSTNECSCFLIGPNLFRARLKHLPNEWLFLSCHAFSVCAQVGVIQCFPVSCVRSEIMPWTQNITGSAMKKQPTKNAMVLCARFILEHLNQK